jgi:hypothetical protein
VATLAGSGLATLRFTRRRLRSESRTLQENEELQPAEFEVEAEIETFYDLPDFRSGANTVSALSLTILSFAFGFLALLQ